MIHTTTQPLTGKDDRQSQLLVAKKLVLDFLFD